MIDTNPTMWSIGLMTGTVLDGNIDVAMLRTDGEQILEVGPFALIPYPAGLLSLLQEALEAARVWQFDGLEPEIFKRAEVALTTAQSNAVVDFLGEYGISKSDIGIVGFHGQSVLHRAPQPGRRGQTRQLGDGVLMNRLLDIPVAYDFRTADITAGGQGAPLAPAYHSALLGQSAVPEKSAVVNLGGVGNITWRNSSGGLAAFDTGPANAPINDLMAANHKGTMDRDGLLAACGTIDEQRLSTLLAHPYFSKSYPKSLDRFDFTADMAQGMALEDAAALLTAFSAAAVAKAVELLQDDIQNLIVCGGGRHNPTLMRQLEIRSGLCVMAAEQVGWRGDATEAECFAFLAVRVMRELPISFPSTTGVAAPMTGGRIVGLPDQAGR